jgi:hypothetical protein
MSQEKENLANQQTSGRGTQAWEWGWSFDPSKVSIYDQAKIRARKHTMSSMSSLAATGGTKLRQAYRRQQTLRYITLFLAFISIGFALATLCVLVF